MVTTAPANRAGSGSILCRVCTKQRAVKYCKDCKDDCQQLCAMCAVTVHEREKNHVVAPLCSECFAAAGRLTCETCQEKLCPACTEPHLEICGCEDGGEGGGNECRSDQGDDEMMVDLCTSSDESGDEDEGGEGYGDEGEDQSEEDEEEQEPDSAAEDEDFDPDGESDDENMTAGEKRKRRAEEAKENKRHKRAAARKIAEVIGHKEVFNRKPQAAAEVSDAVLTRIRKALALGLHPGGNEVEKEHAMKRATKMMQSYGLSQADVEKTGKSDIEAAAGMVAVRLNGLFFKWPQWSYTVMNVADCMAGTASFYTKSGARKGGNKCVEDSMTVTFYGLLSGAEMAAHVFEVAYNTVMFESELEYGDKGQASKKEDYRLGMASGLYNIARRDKKEREMDLQGARERAEHAARVKTEPGASNAAGGGEAAAAKDAEVPGSGEQAAVDAAKESEGMSADATDMKGSDEKMKDAPTPGVVGNGAAGDSKDAETVAETVADNVGNDGAAGGKAAEEEENLWCGDSGDDGGYSGGGGDADDDYDAAHDEPERKNNISETAESPFMSPQEKRKAAAAEKKRERERAKAAKAAEREAKKEQKAAEREVKRIMKEEEKEMKRLAKERERREKEAAKAAKKAEKAAKAGKDQQKAADPVYTDKDIDPDMQQLVLFDDKRQKVIEAVKESINLSKGRKVKWRKIKDWNAYKKGKKDAENVRLGAKALPAPVGSDKEASKGKKTPSETANVKKEPVVKVEDDNGGVNNAVDGSTKVEGVKDEFPVKPEPEDAVA